jgi:hypothetical protein
MYHTLILSLPTCTPAIDRAGVGRRAASMRDTPTGLEVRMRATWWIASLIACSGPSTDDKPTDTDTDLASDVTDVTDEAEPTDPTDAGWSDEPTTDADAPTFAAGACPNDLVAAITACTVDTMAAFGFASTMDEAIAGCAAADAMREAYDDWCAATDPRPALCLGPYDPAWASLNADCADATLTAMGERTCVLGKRLDDPHARRSLTLGRRAVTIDDVPGLTGVDADQLDEVERELGYADAAPMFVEYGGTFEIIDVADRFGGAAYTIWSGEGAGLAFNAGTSITASRLWDGRFEDCTVDPGISGLVCDAEDTCNGLDCSGSPGFPGVCHVDMDSPHRGSPCDGGPEVSCEGGLYCASFFEDGDGICLEPWVVGWFGDAPWSPIAEDGEIAHTFSVSGLATVALQVELSVDIRAEDPASVVVTLENPFGTIADVPVRPTGDDAVQWRGRVFGIPADESVTGTWTLHVRGGGAGALVEARLGLATHWD